MTMKFLSRLFGSGHSAEPIRPFAMPHLPAATVFREPRSFPGILQKRPAVDVVICVHNALEDVRACLNSLLPTLGVDDGVYLVNDGSDAPTSAYLREFAAAPVCRLRETGQQIGYTRSANLGLHESKADNIILLNSDTIVTRGWLERLLECALSASEIGLAGPLSNAASWQSMPEVSMVNPLPEGLSVERVATLTAAMGQPLFPKVPCLNGFCLLIRRPVIEKIGYLDEETFPLGYGEENDFCMRATEAGFTLAVADSCYIYHAKSKSFGHEQRQVLSRQADASLRAKHGNPRVKALIEELQNSSPLAEIRERWKGAVLENRLPEKLAAVGREDGGEPRVLFLLPVPPPGGGVHSVVQEVAAMRRLGVDAQIAISPETAALFDLHYPEVPDRICLFTDLTALPAEFSARQVVVATSNKTVDTLEELLRDHPHLVPGYYIQDYEPTFYEEGSEDRQQAIASYRPLPGEVLFAKTDWVRGQLKQHHGLEVAKVSPGLERALFQAPDPLPAPAPVTHITAMIRPPQSVRAAALTMRVLERLQKKFGNRVAISLFGTRENREFLALSHDFSYTLHGRLRREQVAELLRASEVFVDFSTHQAFGRTAFEAMACGCAVIVPREGGVYEFARDKENALIVDTADEEACYRALVKLVTNAKLRQKLRKAAVKSLEPYSTGAAALTELEVLLGTWLSSPSAGP